MVERDLEKSCVAMLSALEDLNYSKRWAEAREKVKNPIYKPADDQRKVIQAAKETYIKCGDVNLNAETIKKALEYSQSESLLSEDPKATTYLEHLHLFKKIQELDSRKAKRILEGNLFITAEPSSKEDDPTICFSNFPPKKTK